ncbi:hypothetical protein MRQ86_01050 [Streptomyces sp. MMS21 TC-5]|nr:hypothetical protein [Streptomyces sp. MMS21 TC-5]MCI4078961.1 hypothetical protein [Streptomyces sp. MMS21 TC-5]
MSLASRTRPAALLAALTVAAAGITTWAHGYGTTPQPAAAQAPPAPA